MGERKVEIKTSRPSIFPECANCISADDYIRREVDGEMAIHTYLDLYAKDEWARKSIEVDIECNCDDPTKATMMGVTTTTTRIDGVVDVTPSPPRGVVCPARPFKRK